VHGTLHDAALASGKLTRVLNRRSAYPSEVIMSRLACEGEIIFTRDETLIRERRCNEGLRVGVLGELVI
jgi:hypothetical protein